MTRIAVFASGNGSNFAALAAALPNEIKLVFSDQADAYVLERANQAGVPSAALTRRDFASKEAFEEAILALLREYEIDLICLAGYMKFVGPTLLNGFNGQIINIHPSLLPQFAGSPHAIDVSWAAQTGLGVTVHYVDAGIDTGEIIKQQPVPYVDDLATYAERVHAVEHQLYVEVVQQLLATKKDGQKA